jgi:undecaprenyl diphosphate synthase
MDGNGRWAKQHGMSRIMGHKEGVVSVRKVSEAAGRLGVKYMTVYTFSTENWKRPKEEIDALMELMVTAIRNEAADLMTNNVRLLAIGDIDLLPPLTRQKLGECLTETSGNTGLTLILALSYSSRRELTEAARRIAVQVENGSLKAEDIDEQTVADNLFTAGIPDPDLLVRTGGEKRLSNYLLWQSAYAELYFSDVYWPDFREEELYAAIVDYQHRQRRFGKTGEQVQTENKTD